MQRMIKFLLALTALMLTACSANYTSVIPQRCQLLATADPLQLLGTDSWATQLAAFVGAGGMDCRGIDPTEKLYLFETADGLFGLVAGVSSRSDAEEWLKSTGRPQKSRRGFLFTDLGNGFLAAVADHALLVMGPSTDNSLSALQQRMVRCLESKGDNDITTTELYSVLERTAAGSPVALVAKAGALPSQIAPLLTLDSLRGDEPIYVTATLQRHDSLITVNSDVYAPDSELAALLRKRHERFRPLEGRYGALMTDSTALSLFVNTDGETLLQLLRSSQALKLLLAGSNRAIDTDNIIRSIDGETAIALHSLDFSHPSFRLNATIAHARFLDDVGYWQRSCPAGCSISSEGSDAYVCRWPGAEMFFGTDAARREFYAYTPGITATVTPVATAMEGHRLCIASSREALLRQDGVGQTVLSPLKLLLGDAKALVWWVK